jgi:cation transport protein ChaC
MHDPVSLNPLWVFGYGSLMWQPDFPVAEARVARVTGWHRSFCMWSIHHRGTVAAPGLVLALDAAPGGVCDGLALRVAPGAEGETLAMLRERELVSSAYLETVLPVGFADGGAAQALAYVIDPAHPQHTGPLALEDQARIIAGASGGRGPNRDYLWATVAHLTELGIDDPDLRWLAARVRVLAGA